MKNFKYQIGGSLPLNASTYVKRESDDILYNNIVNLEYCYVFAPRQFGKSSMRVRISKHLEQEGYICCNIDLTSIGSEDINTSKWYYSFLIQITKSLKIKRTLFREWWEINKNRTEVDKFSIFIEELIFKYSKKKLVIFIDEIDSLIKQNYISTDDFFAVIRSFYNKRADDERYNNIIFVLIGVATASDLMKDETRTPFNISLPVYLRPLEFEQSKNILSNGLEGKNIDSNTILERIFYWSGGHPYLTQKICFEVQTKEINNLNDIDNIVNYIFFNKKTTDHNIQSVESRIIQHEKYNILMLEVLYKILNGEKVKLESNNLTQIYLKLSGLLIEKNNILVYSNKIYEKVFNRKWIEHSIDKINRPISKYIQIWIKNNKDKSCLLKSDELEKILNWAKNRNDLTHIENEFIRLSQEADRDSIIATQEEERKFWLKNKAISNKLLIILSLVLLFSTILSMILYLNTKKSEVKAKENEKRAKEQEKIAKEQLEEIKKLRYSDYCYRAKEHLDKEEYNQSINNYIKAITIDNNNTKAYIQLAQVYNKIEDYNNEAKIYEDIYKITRDNTIKFKLAKAYYLANNYKKALNNFKEVIKVNPKKYRAYYNIGLIYLKQKNIDKAITSFIRTIELNPNYYKAYIKLGNIYYNNKDYDISVQLYSKGLNINKKEKDYKTYYKIGYSYLMLNKFSKSIEYLNKALKYTLDQKNKAKIYNNLGFAYFKQKLYKQAKNSYLKAYKLNPNIKADYYTMGIVYKELNEFTKSKEMFNKSIIEKPKNEEDFINNAKAYKQLKKYNKAIESYKYIIKKESNNTNILIKLGILYNEVGKYTSNTQKAYKYYQHALNIFDRIIKIDLNNDDAYYNRGNTYYRLWTYYKKDTYNDAINDYKKAFTLNPNNIKAYNDLAYTYLRNNKYNDAIKLYNKVIEINPKHYRAYNSLGIAYLYLAVKNNKFYSQDAVKAFRKAVEINQKYSNAYLNIFKLQLFNNEFFDQEIENKYINNFKDNKENYILYKMLKILQAVNNNMKYNFLLVKWQKDFENTKLHWGSYYILDKWVKNHKNKTIKDNLIKVIKIFKNHNKDIRKHKVKNKDQENENQKQKLVHNKK